MKTLARLLLTLVVLLAVAVVLVYADGASLPLNHTASITGIVPAPPAKVFALITHVAAGGEWRHEVKKVTVLPPESGPNGPEDHWIEDLGHGQTMTFLATQTIPDARREVLLDVPGASYGGTWTYELSPGPTPAQTTLKITESGFIHPPIYRFMMAHIFGMTHNLDQYMADIQAAAAKA
jgi:hypothetical protein